jgi:dTDP-3,4-didehydro-2,6-dideoxy-alpha-D-glucose 3-reductase
MLVVGFSSVVQRRVIPACQKVWPDQTVDVATVSRASAAASATHGTIYRDYDEALKKSGAGIVYISLPNSQHFELAKRSLESGRHVIIDKPACIDFEQADQLVAEARQRNLLIAEATVFSHHRQISRLNALRPELGPIKTVTAHFIIPPMPLENFRNHAEFGGGCLLDMGPYAAGIIRLFSSPNEDANLVLHGVSRGRHPVTGVDTDFSILAMTASGTRIAGHFGFDGEYDHRLVVVAERGCITMDRVFSPPSDLDVTWRLRASNRETNEQIGPDDAFAVFLKTVDQATVTGRHGELAEIMLRDARLRARISSVLP